MRLRLAPPLPPTRPRPPACPPRAVALAAVLLAVLAALPAAGQGAEAAFVRDSLALEQRLMRESLSDFEQAGAPEAQARRELQDAMTQLTALSGEVSNEAAVGNLRRAEQRVADAASAWRGATARLDAAVARLEVRLQRLRMLAALEASGAATRVTPDVAGVWRVAVEPGGEVGVYDLQQDGTVLSGTFRMEGGSRGSLRGTVSNNRVRLERLDATRGFESTFWGDVDASGTVITGQWTSSEVSGGTPSGGPWRAERETEDEEAAP